LPKPNSRLPLNSLRTFEAAARRLSFKDAAVELFVSSTTVSNQIRELEREWGCELFIRKTRKVVLTDAGRSLALVLGRAFADIRREIDTHVAPTSRAVSLAVGPIFGSRWLIPRLSRFHKAHPDIELQVNHSPRITNVESIDSLVTVDWGTGEWDGLDVTKLVSIVYSPIISPVLSDAYEPSRRPIDLARFPIIHQRDRSEWLAWFAISGESNLSFRDELVVIDSNTAVQAAIDAQGVALGSFPFLDAEVEAGRLLRPFDIDLTPSRSYNMLTRPGARRTPEVDALCQWLLSEARLTTHEE
jgi:LysR family glycine cleavage system transcriptional activator